MRRYFRQLIPAILTGLLYTAPLPAQCQAQVYAWGYNGYGGLGDGTLNDSNVAEHISTLSDATMLAAGGYHSLAILSDRTVWAWGWNGAGQLGDGTTVDSLIPEKISALSSVTAVAANYFHSLAVESDGTVWAWGDNQYGELGDGTVIPRLAPVQVAGLTGVVAVAAGIYHSLALKSDGTVWAWGSNQSGELGIGYPPREVHTPVQVSGLSGVIAIAANNDHSLALLSNGTVCAWGNDAFGQCGDGTTGVCVVPVQALGLSGITKIAAGRYHSLALGSDGTVWAWGSNLHGQLGDGTTTDESTPEQVGTITRATAIAAGEWHSLVIRSDGTAWAWGFNGYGTLGDGTTTDRYVPVQVSGLGRVVAISAGFSHNLAIVSAPETAVLKAAKVSGGLCARVTLRATLTSNKVAVPGRTVQFSIDGAVVGSAVTSSTGLAAFKWRIPSSTVLGDHTIAADFAGDSTFKPAQGTNTLTVTKGSVRLSVPAVSGTAGTTVHIKATLLNNAGEPLAGRSLAFAVNYVSQGSVVTDASGVAIIDYTIPNAIAGTVIPDLVLFSGDSLYLEKTTIGKITVK